MIKFCAILLTKKIMFFCKVFVKVEIEGNGNGMIWVGLGWSTWYCGLKWGLVVDVGLGLDCGTWARSEQSSSSV